jgi:hypothetical protein
LFEIGLSLAAARRAQQLELADVEALTCIRSRHLAALESERFDALPGRAYTRAFLRTYANALGLEADRFVSEFEERHPEPEHEEIAIMLPRRRRRIPMRVLVMLAAAAATIGFVAWSGSSYQTSPPQLAPPTAARAAAPAKPVQAVAATPVPAVLVIRAVNGDCWLFVRRGSKTGPVLYEATLRRGHAIRFGNAKVWVRFGAPWNVDVRRGGRPVKGVSGGSRTPINLVA